MDAIVVGIDVSKDRLDVHVAPAGEAFFVSNDAAGAEALAGRLAVLGPAVVALEATGPTENTAGEAFLDKMKAKCAAVSVDRPVGAMPTATWPPWRRAWSARWVPSRWARSSA